MDTFLDWLQEDSDMSDEEYSIGDVTPRDDSADDSVSSGGEQSLELSTAETQAAAEGTDASEEPCAEDQSTLGDSAVAGTIPCIYLLP